MRDRPSANAGPHLGRSSWATQWRTGTVPKEQSIQLWTPPYTHDHRAPGMAGGQVLPGATRAGLGRSRTEGNLDGWVESGERVFESLAKYSCVMF